MADPFSAAASVAATSTALPTSVRLAKKDVEASKLVFVYLRGAKPKRKVALAVSDSMSWSTFIMQVEKKLRMTKTVASIWYANGGSQVTSVDQLQDIDELEVEEETPGDGIIDGSEVLLLNGAVNGHGIGGDFNDMNNRQQMSAVSSPPSMTVSLQQDAAIRKQHAQQHQGIDVNLAGDEEEGNKYQRRGTMFQRIRRMFPAKTNISGTTMSPSATSTKRRALSTTQYILIFFALLWIGVITIIVHILHS